MLIHMAGMLHVGCNACESCPMLKFLPCKIDGWPAGCLDRQTTAGWMNMTDYTDPFAAHRDKKKSMTMMKIMMIIPLKGTM